MQSGDARVIDYKSGATSTAKEVKTGFSPQLTLEAEMLRQGGFKGWRGSTPKEALLP